MKEEQKYFDLDCLTEDEVRILSQTAYMFHYDELSGGLHLKNGHLFAMNYDLLIKVCRGILQYLEIHKNGVEIDIYNSNLSRKYQLDMEEVNQRAKEEQRKPIPGYFLFIKKIHSNEYKYVYGNIDEVYDRINNIQFKFDVPVEVFRAYKTQDIYGLRTRIERNFKGKRNINKWIELDNKDTALMIKQAEEFHNCTKIKY